MQKFVYNFKNVQSNRGRLIKKRGVKPYKALMQIQSLQTKIIELLQVEENAALLENMFINMEEFDENEDGESKFDENEEDEIIFSSNGDI